MAKTHPHIESPSAEQLQALVAERPEHLAECYLALHQLVLDVLPEVRFAVDTVDHSIGHGAHQYGYNGWGMAALTPFGKWVSLTLLQGAGLEDPAALLSGTSTMRHFKVSDPAAVGANRGAIGDLVLAASRFHAY